jgi:glucosamine kinase
MPDSIYIGFDGGGSTSRFLIRHGKNDPKLFSYPVNLKYSDIGIDKAAKNFAHILSEILGEDISLLKALCISLSGASNPEFNNEFIDALRKALASTDLRIHIESDSSFALHTAYSASETGMLLIAGTGSVAIAKKKNSEIVKVGGWGRMLGDEGSGYWIGMQALKHYCRVLDGIENQGTLFLKIEEKFYNEGYADFSSIRRNLYSYELKLQDYAPIVFEELARDLIAKRILDDAIHHLMIIVKALWIKSEDGCAPVLSIHGTIARQNYITENIAIQCKLLHLESKMIDEKMITEKALEIAEHLS